MTASLPTAATQRTHDIQSELADWKSIVSPYQQPSTGRAAWQVLNTVVPFLALWAAMYFVYPYSLVATFAIGTLASFFLVRVFIIQHDCGHYSFLKSRRQSDWVGWGCSLLSTIPYTYWSRVHAFHHGHVGQLEHRDVGDINFLTVDEYRTRTPFGRLRYRIFRSGFVIAFMAPLLYITIMCRIPKIWYEGWSGVHTKLHLNNLAIVGVYAVLGYVLGWERFLVIQGTTVLGFSIIAFWFFYVQHQHEDTYMRWTSNWNYLQAAIQGATLYDLPRVMHWLTGDIGYHHIHHLSSRIPNYNLERCARENPLLQKYVRKVTFMESLPMINNKLWDEDRKRMITFAEYARCESRAES